MPFLVRNISLALDEPEDLLPARAAKRLRVPPEAIRCWSIVARSIDARKKDIHLTYHLEVALDEPPQREHARLRRLHDPQIVWIDRRPEPPLNPGSAILRERPIIVGFGPGGMFAALRLAELGYRPIVLERGREVRRRHRDIMQRFYREGEFDPTSNLLFGEGGAGTYSDGKLYTRGHDPRCRRVLEVFFQHGADPRILIDARPHIGSDRLPTICTRIRRRIEALGGEVRFETLVDDVRIDGGRLIAIHARRSDSVDGGAEVSGRASAQAEACSSGGEWIEVGPVILSIGHSARDTLRRLHARGVRVEAKPFQIGVRIEHPQSLVDRWQYGACAGHARLGSAEYHVVAKGAAGELGDVFSFCMCPGGIILPSNESCGLIVTNGASRSQRSSPFANSGLVVTVEPSGLGLSAMTALNWQQRWEELAYAATGCTYRVPCQRASDFLVRRASDGVLTTSYPLGGAWCDVRTLLPDSVSTALEKALPMLERKMPGYAGADAVITAPETRASAPIRLVRDPESREAVGITGLYPVGEGAGYAGGIVSAAVDGLKSAERIVCHYAPPA